ncbi:MAG: HEAT repeat domain-containing protein [Candidatus Acidiferrum sp.]
MKHLATACLLTVFLFYAPPALPKEVVTGRFYPEKQNYLVGEPIIVDLEIVNGSSRVGELGETNCPSLNRWRFEVDGATPKKDTAPFTCAHGSNIVDCLVGARPIPAHGKYVRRLLLNGPFSLNVPGTYHVRAKFDQNITTGSSYKILAHLLVESEFDVMLRAPQKGELEVAYKPFLDDLLRGKDYEIQAFAASAITQNPPPFAEAAITDLIGNPVLTGIGLEGLGRLATSTARARLTEASTIGPEEFRQPAIKALGEAGNPEDCRTLLDIASQNKYYTQEEAYVFAGRVCRDQAIPALSRLLSDADEQLSTSVATALENTSSRYAVPPLIGLLTNADKSILDSAEEALATLTHRKSRYGVASKDSSYESRFAWWYWWATNRDTAPIYGPDQCIDPQPLP